MLLIDLLNINCDYLINYLMCVHEFKQALLKA